MTKDELVERLLKEFPDGIIEFNQSPDGTKDYCSFIVCSAAKTRYIKVSMSLVLNLQDVHGPEAVELYIESLHNLYSELMKKIKETP